MLSASLPVWIIRITVVGWVVAAMVITPFFVLICLFQIGITGGWLINQFKTGAQTGVKVKQVIVWTVATVWLIFMLNILLNTLGL
jgi:hypothetical protein